MPFKSLSMLFVCIGYIVGGLLFIPFLMGAVNSYTPWVTGSTNPLELAIAALVVVAIPFILSYGLWKGYRFAWGLSILLSVFDIILYVIVFSSLRITLANGPIIDSSAFGFLGYSVAYGMVYIGTYLLAIVDILLNLGLVYYLTRKRTKRYFGIG